MASGSVRFQPAQFHPRPKQNSACYNPKVLTITTTTTTTTTTGDCKPRKEAACLTVKKEGKNQGRRFWTCTTRGLCNFFLWEDDARAREADAVRKFDCPSENGITTRVQGRDQEAPPGLDMRAQQRGTTEPATTTTTPPPPPGRQRVFKDHPPGAVTTPTPRKNSSRNSDTDWDSDGISIDGDEGIHRNNNMNNNIIGQEPPTTVQEDLTGRDNRAEDRRIMNGGGRGASASSETQTLQQNSTTSSGGSGSAKRTTTAASGPRGGGGAVVRGDVAKSPARTITDYYLTTPSANKNKKRKRLDLDNSSSDEFGGADLSDSDTERQLAAMTDESASRRQRQQQQQRQLLAKTTGMTTGGNLLFSGGVAGDVTNHHNTTTTTPAEYNGGLATPRTSRNSLRIADEERERAHKRPRRTVGFADQDQQDQEEDDQGNGDITTTNTPTPYRKTNALAPPYDPPSDAAVVLPQAPHSHHHQPPQQTPGGNSTSTSTALALVPTTTMITTPLKPTDYPTIADHIKNTLAPEPISETARRNVAAALALHDQRVKGLARGKDVLRAKLQARDAEVAALQARVAHLEDAHRAGRAELARASEELRMMSERDD